MNAVLQLGFKTKAEQRAMLAKFPANVPPVTGYVLFINRCDVPLQCANLEQIEFSSLEPGHHEAQIMKLQSAN